MRAISRSLASALLLLLAACHYDLDRDLPSVTIPGSDLTGPLPTLFSLGVQSADEAGYDAGLVKDAKLRHLRLRIAPHDAPVGNFDFLESVRVFVDRAEGAPEPRECARLDPVPRGATTIALEPLGVDLAAYLETGAKITGLAVGRFPEADVTIDGDLSVRLYF